MNEYDLIQRMSACFPRCGAQANSTFTADAELVRLGSETWAITVDEFSAEEDGFSDDDPAALGRNLAVATLSDLFAVGARPRFFLQVLALPDDKGEAFALAVCEGIAAILRETGCCLLGGDTSVSRTWRFSGVALGDALPDPPLTRSFDGRDVEIWVSGPLGDANAALLADTPTPRFELRLEAAAIAAHWARGCIDTSGGLLEALHMLSRVNPAACIELDLDQVPLAAGVGRIAAAAGVSPVAALVGGAGEYELLFGIPKDAPGHLCQELTLCGATRIGQAQHCGGGGMVVRSGQTVRPAPPCPDPRAFASRADYREQVVKTALDLGGTDP